jgi:hypothetical protein
MFLGDYAEYSSHIGMTYLRDHQCHCSSLSPNSVNDPKRGRVFTNNREVSAIQLIHRHVCPCRPNRSTEIEVDAYYANYMAALGDDA